MNNYDDFYKKFPGFNAGSEIQHPTQGEFAVSFFEEKENGIFVDVGAHNGIAWSNTFIFEKLFSWSGICIEGNESLCEDLNKNRTSECLHHAVDDNETEQIFWNADGIGGLEKGFQNGHVERIRQELNAHNLTCNKVQITTKRLSTILASRNISHVDYLSIDVEGNELGVLKSFDFDNCSCGLISAESNDRKSVQDYLYKSGYELIAKVCNDDFYCATKNPLKPSTVFVSKII